MPYSWSLPAPAATPTPSSSSSTSSATTPASRGVLGGVLDMEIDPVTLDYLDTDNGAWSETADARSIVLCQLELELGASYSTPGDGTEIKARLRDGEPLTTTIVEADVLRAMRVLEAAGVIGSPGVNGRDANGEQLVDEHGRALFELTWIDLATGSPVEDVYHPTGG